MFNEIGGKVQKIISCDKCAFVNNRFCDEIDGKNPLFITCIGSGFVKTNLDIFEL